jgi:hypothetical protein
MLCFLLFIIELVLYIMITLLHYHLLYICIFIGFIVCWLRICFACSGIHFSTEDLFFLGGLLLIHTLSLLLVWFVFIVYLTKQGLFHA